MPDCLHFTGNDEADRLLVQEPMALLIGFALDQQVPVPTAFLGPLKLKQRLGTLDPGRIATTDPAALEAAFREKPAIHRFPGNMARRVQELAAVVEEQYGGHAERIWTEASSGPDLVKRVMALPGFGRQKAQIFTALVAKQLGVRPDGWERAVGDYARDGYRSVADVVDPASLQKVRAYKQEKKAAQRATAGDAV